MSNEGKIVLSRDYYNEVMAGYKRYYALRHIKDYPVECDEPSGASDLKWNAELDRHLDMVYDAYFNGEDD